MLDVNTRLSGTTGSAAAGQSIATATAAAPVYSTNWLDLGSGTKRELRDMFASFWFTTLPDSATNNATLDLEIVMSPLTTPGTPTFTFTAAADDVVTANAHGLIAGTRVTLTTSAADLPLNLTIATNYFLRDVTTNTFKLALTPGGAAVDIGDAGTGTHTITWYPEVVGAASKVALERLTAGSATGGAQVQPRVNPLLLGSPNFPVHRYLFARYVPTADLTAGVAFCDLRSGAPMSNFPINPINYVTA